LTKVLQIHFVATISFQKADSVTLPTNHTAILKAQSPEKVNRFQFLEISLLPVSHPSLSQDATALTSSCEFLFHPPELCL